MLPLSPDGTVTNRSAFGWLAAGPNIACFPRAKVDITFAKQYTSFQASSEAVFPSSALLGPDGNIWFTDADHSDVGRIFPDGRYTTFAAGLTRWDSGPQFITVGADRNLWFTEQRDRIGRITLDRRITEFYRGIPKRSSLGGIVAGPDGNLWFTLYQGRVLGRITLQGNVTIYHDLIVLDKAGRLYYNEGQAGRIARLTILAL